MLTKAQRGFTLIELIIVMAIVGILFSLALPSYQAWVQNTKIRTAAESILNGLQQARAEAVRRNTNVGLYLVSSLDSACVGDATKGNWIISQQAPDGLCDVAPSDTIVPQIIQKNTQQEGSTNVVTLTSLPAGGDSVVFSSLGQSRNPGTDLTQIDFAAVSPVAVGSRPLRILIGAGGSLKMCDPNATSSDPRGC
ncbi:MAG: GspH/FimT family pseudopilin [Chitinivorax sp.]